MDVLLEGFEVCSRQEKAVIEGDVVHGTAQVCM